MPIVYSAVKRFDPTAGEAWQSFIQWSGLAQVREVISLDGILCPSTFRELSAEDWQHNVQADFKTHLFSDLEYVLKKVAGDERTNVLALMENPSAEDFASFADFRFTFRGFDLTDVQGGNSALVNCGGFDKAFSKAELSEFGLVTGHQRACDIRQALQDNYFNEQHAICDVWALWQLIPAIG